MLNNKFRWKLKWRLIITIGIALIILFLSLNFIFRNTIRNNIYQEKRGKIESLVKNAINTLHFYHQLEENGELETSEAQLMAQQQLENFRYGEEDRNYFWILNYQAEILMHPFREDLIGTDLTNIEDPNNFEFIPEMVTLAREKGSGFMEYEWQYYGDIERIEPKISHVQRFEPWNWVIGTGIYVNDIQQTIISLRNKLAISGGITLIIIFILLYHFSLNISQPIAQLADDMKKFSGDKKSKLKIDKTDIIEINEIVESYQEMVEEIYSNYEEIEASSEEIAAMNMSLVDSYERKNKINQSLNEIISVISSLSKSTLTDDKEFLKKVFRTSMNIIEEADYGSVYIYEKGGVKYIDTVGHNLKLLQEIPLNKDIFYQSKENIIVEKTIENHILEGLNQEYRDKFLKAVKPTYATMTFDLVVNGKQMAGISLDVAREKQSHFSEDSRHLFAAVRDLATTFYKLQSYSMLQDRFKKEIIFSITQLLEIYDEYTQGHSHNVAHLASKIAYEMKLAKEKVTQTYWAGMVHDIGKILVPLEILNKKGPLTDEEYDEIKIHPYWGFLTLSNSEELEPIARYVLHHHECWDGSGYPDGLKGEEIPLISSILAVADAWDAMTSDRSYRKALSKEKALQEIRQNKGHQFSPRVVDTFLKMKEKS
ncbi:MAG: HD domain-containing phosphohydrolase [Halanaerobiaceae bacterium]